MHIALLFIAISLIVINYSFYQSMSKCTKKFGYNIVVTIPKKTITLDPEKLLRRDTCYLNKEDNCKVGSYKQCTNNVKPISNCDCKEPYFELCSLINSSSSKDNSHVYDLRHVDNHRVNIYNSEQPSFNLSH